MEIFIKLFEKIQNIVTNIVQILIKVGQKHQKSIIENAWKRCSKCVVKIIQNVEKIRWNI